MESNDKADTTVPDAIIKSGLIHQTGRDRGVEEVEVVMTGEAGDERPEEEEEEEVLVVVVGAVQEGRKGRGVWK